ncbi:MAG: hypothetical protein ABIS07_07105 [Dokdonella sp.]
MTKQEKQMFDDVLKRMLSTPPAPHAVPDKPKVKKKPGPKKKVK